MVTTPFRLVLVREGSYEQCPDCQPAPCHLNRWGQCWLIVEEPDNRSYAGTFALFAASWAWAAS